MAKSKIRMFLEIKNKENKTELEELYLTLRNYNFIACELVVMLQKLEISFYDFVEERKNNYSKNINSKTKEIMTKYKKEIKKMKEITEWGTDDITFEQVFLLEYEQAMDNIIKDSYHNGFQ